MFTGIISDIGTIELVEQMPEGRRFHVSSIYDLDGIDIGASIAHDGVCLTVVEKTDKVFVVEAWEEALRLTSADQWTIGSKINLERALRVGDELGGHIVTGHVDAVGTVSRAEATGDSWSVDIRAPAALAPFIAPKGSITVQGVSLTVNDIRDEDDGSCTFMLNIIPHTGEVTTLGALKLGDKVNLEIDVLARYLKRMQALAG